VARILLLDGNSLVYRAFFALPTDMATASGQVTNAVFGFTSMLTNLFKDHRPDLVVVAFDRPEPTFRHALVPDYKAGRAETPDILRQQMGLVRQVIDTLGLPMVEMAGFEADDVLATLATQGRERGDDVIVVTGDRDVYQLVEDPCVRVLYNRRGVSDYVLYDEAGIFARTGVTPVQYPMYAALRGDPSDNLPGVPGVGEKTAARLINSYGDLEGIYANLGALTPKLRENLAAAHAQVLSNAQATPLVRDVPLETSLDSLAMGSFDVAAVRDLFAFLEFRSLFDRLVAAMHPQGGAGAGVETMVAPTESKERLDVGVLIADIAGAVAVLSGPGSPRGWAPAWAGDAGRSELLGLAVAEPGGAQAHWISADVLAAPAVTAAVAVAPFHAHGAKEMLRWFAQRRQHPAGLVLDSSVAAYLIEPGDANYHLADLAARFCQIDVTAPDGPPPGQLDLSGRVPDPAAAAAREAVAVDRLAPVLSGALEKRRLSRLYDEIERPLVAVLARMEAVGVRVDADRLRHLYNDVVAEAQRLEHEIQGLAGEAFMINSTLQLRRILFDKLGLAPQKKTKTGFSTDAASLARLAGEHPIIEPLLRYREMEKLRSTYGEGLLAEVGGDGRIHASFNQTVARTGRLSSDRPNLHNIPVRTDEGRRIRSAFIPTDGHRFLVADYNQIELRVIAHLARDPGLIAAFESGADIHSETAARIFGCEPAEVTLGQRSKAKMVSYGLAYGMESFGLGQRLGIATSEAATILDAYFAAFPGVRAYMDATVAEARDRGYTETLFGRRRQIPELSSTNFRLRQAGERQAMNAGIQGLAADIFKVALVRLDRDLLDAGLTSRLVLQVHDEVILEVPPAEEGRAAELTLGAMESAADLSVPLEVNVSWASSWADAKTSIPVAAGHSRSEGRSGPSSGPGGDSTR